MVELVLQLVLVVEPSVEVAHTDCTMVVTTADCVERVVVVLVDSLLLVEVPNWVSVGDV